MKLTALLLTIALVQAHASGNAQNVTISGKDIPLMKVFTEIKKQTGYLLFSKKELLTASKPVTVVAQNMPLKELLDLVMKNQPLEYEIQGKTIILSRKAIELPDPENYPPTPVSLFPPTIRGKVYSSDGQPISGATVSVRGTSRGTTTEANGVFALPLNKGEILDISSIAYLTLSISYEGSEFKLVSNEKKRGENNSGKLVDATVASLTIMLARSTSPLDEVQITAYGKTSRRMATGSISTIKGEEFEKQPIFNALQAIAGRVPGVTVQQMSGNPAAPIEVIIRGRNSITPGANNDPLYVIDGLPLSNLNVSFQHSTQTTSMGAVQGGLPFTLGENPLNRINPLDIESMTVLKDADATAIYGSRGANGVILITTKKGKAGPASFNLQIQNGITMVQKYPKVLSTKEYLAVRREAIQNDGIIPDRENALDLVEWDSTRDHDWRRELIGTGIDRMINASVGGGTNQTRYNVSASYQTLVLPLNQGGSNDRVTFKTGFSNTSSNQKLTLDVSSSLTFMKVDALAISDPSNIPPNAPPIYNEKGELNFEPFRKTFTTTFSTYFGSLRKPSLSKTTSTLSNLNLSYKIIKGLTFIAGGAFSFDYNENVRKDPEGSFDPLYFGSSMAMYGVSKTSNWQMSTQVAYETFIGKGSFNSQLIATYSSIAVGSETITAEKFPNDDMMKSWNNAEAVDALESKGYGKTLSFTGILSYNWDGKYIINLSGTRDGSPHFGKGKRFGNFGSVGLSWIASEEKWMKNFLPSWFSLLKFRGSYGITGSSSIPPYENLSRWSKSVKENNSRTLIKYNDVTAFHVIKPLNQEYHWVNTKKISVALEAGFLNDRISLTIEPYRTNSTAQLATEPIPQYTGFSSVFTNTYANLQNTGLEIGIGASILRSKDWSLSMNFNISGNRNKLIDFPYLDQSSHKGRLKIGYSTTTVFKLRYTGINPLNGNYTFEDYNKDGRIFSGGTIFPLTDFDDRYVAIETTNKFDGGVSYTLGYKSFRLFMQFDFSNKLRVDPYVTANVGQMKNTALPREILDNHWKQPGDIVKYPRYTTGIGIGSISESDAAYVNGSYFRLNNVNISWSIPNVWAQRVKMRGATLAISTSNVYTFTRYRGLDPMVNNAQSAIPIPRIISTSLNFQF